MTQLTGAIFSLFLGGKSFQGKGPKDIELGRWWRTLTSVSLLEGLEVRQERLKDGKCKGGQWWDLG